MTRAVAALAFGFAAFASFASAYAGELPARIDPAAPFPRIIEQAPAVESVAPGIEYGSYQLETAAGPLAIRIVAIRPQSDVRVDSVVANDSLVSKGETVGSMARRTRAVAGINADFFDIGNTNRPVNMVVRAGALLQVPYKRYVLAIQRDGNARIAEFSFSGEVVVNDRTMPLGAIDDLPQSGSGLALITPLYGRVPPRDNLTLLALEPLDGVPPFARYRVASIADNLSPQPPGYYLAIGPSDYGVVGVPETGSLVKASGDLEPIALASLFAAVGGGALVLHQGEWYDDPDAPYREENERRLPCSGAAIASDGRIFFIEVDGRQPEISVGVTRRELAALMRAIGAEEGLLFDGGGSSTLVVRRLGDAYADVVNSPSDGRERPVADGIFAYSTDPIGPPVRLVARPGIVRALGGAEVPLRVAAVDAAYHVASSEVPVSVSVVPSQLGDYRNGTFVALHAGVGRLELHAGPLRGNVPVEVEASPARSKIVPQRPNVDVDGRLGLRADAYDAHGYLLALPPQLRWSATAGSIDGFGRFAAGSHNADVTVRIGQSVASARVTVGTHEVALPFAQRARFVTIRRGGGGSIDRADGCGSCLRLSFSFGNGERAAYALADLPLPADTIGLTFDVLDDGSAARLRVAVRNEIDEDLLLDATQFGQPGWRTIAVRFPAGTNAARLISIYVLPLKGIELSDGSIVLRNVRAVVAGR